MEKFKNIDETCPIIMFENITLIKITASECEMEINTSLQPRVCIMKLLSRAPVIISALDCRDRRLSIAEVPVRFLPTPCSVSHQ